MKKKILTFPLKLSLSLILLGSLFKSLLWPGSIDLLVCGTGITCILYTIRFFVFPSKTAMDIAKYIWVLLACYFFSTTFLNWPSLNIINILVVLTGFYWVYKETPKYFNQTSSRTRKTLFAILVSSSVLLLFMGYSFRIMHWPFAPIFTLIGYLLSIICVLTESLVLKRGNQYTEYHLDILDEEFVKRRKDKT